MTTDDQRLDSSNPPPPPGLSPAIVADSMVAMRTAWVGFYDAEYAAVIRFVMHAGPASLDMPATRRRRHSPNR